RRVAGLEARVVDRRHELLREERAHRLADEVRGRDARDPEPIGELGRDGRLAGSGRAADEEDQRQVELAELPVAAEPAGRLRALVLAEHLAGELGEPLVVECLLAAFAEVGLDAQRELVRADGRDPGRHQRAGKEALGVRELVLAGERARVPPGHFAAPWGTRASSRSSRPSETTSFRTKTTSAPRRRACRATTSIAAAFTSTR